MSLDDEMKRIEHLLDDLDAIPRSAWETYRRYPAEIRVEHSSRAAATCTYDHMDAEAARRLLGRAGIVQKDISGQKLWIVEDKAVVRFKKMDEDGRSRNYPTKQARTFDRGLPLPGLPTPAVRLTVGYLLDITQSEYVRTQVSKPRARGVEWCVAIVPAVGGGAGKQWVDVTRR
jgi:hypothetical protein